MFEEMNAIIEKFFSSCDEMFAEYHKDKEDDSND